MAEIVLDIERLNTSGDGIARHRGQIITVPFTIPGERARVSLDRSGTRAAALLEVVRSSPHRVQPGCSHFGVCGGCAWQHIAYPEQLRLKTEMVDRLVKRAVPKAPAALPMIAATSLEDPWHYRQKVHFVFGSPHRSSGPSTLRVPQGRPEQGRGATGSGPSRPFGVAQGRPELVEGRAESRDGGPSLIMGHYVRGSRRVLAVRECPVHDERGNSVAFGLFNAYSKLSGRHGLPTLKSIAIRVSSSTHDTMATLIVTDNSDQRLRSATRQALSAPWAPSSFHINVHPRGDAYIFGPKTRRITGTERLRDEVSGATFLISPTAFFQTNVRAAEILVRLVLEAVPADVSVLDLYAGAGLFALPLAKRGQRVTAVEANRAAVEDGEASLRVSRIPLERCRFVATPVSTFTAAFARGLRRGRLVPVVILDPPREGCEAVVLDDVFGRMSPATAVYVSCNPETLARDLQLIVRHGYAIQSMQPVDMFPHTPHIETVVVISNR